MRGGLYCIYYCSKYTGGWVRSCAREQAPTSIIHRDRLSGDSSAHGKNGGMNAGVLLRRIILEQLVAQSGRIKYPSPK